MRTEKTECRMPNCQRPHIRGECDKNCYYNTWKVMTNFYRIISKSPEEMAAWIADHPVVSEYDENNPKHKAWLDWLKQEAGE